VGVLGEVEVGAGPAEPNPEDIPAVFAPYMPPALRDVNVPAYILDRQGRICWFNRAAQRIAGHTVGRDFTEVIAGVDAADARRRLQARLDGSETGDHALSFVDPEGRETPVEISSVPIGPDHHALGMFGLAVPTRPAAPRSRTDSPLTARQHEILDLLAEGASSDQIAQQLFLSRQTVRNHVQHILRRLNSNSRLQAIATARHHGLI
jgi:PAS domain S-box-containing protein